MSDSQEVEALRRENALLREQTALLKDERLDLRRCLDLSEAERRETQGKLTALLAHQPEPKPEAAQAPASQPQSKGKLWEKLFGGRSSS